jgi:cellulose synthase/poly-beta-1,6-N-acetylglucosamine synthase-like glycosyltransferase
MRHISVVIPSRGNLDSLEKCLAALVAQDFGGWRFEVIVVDAAGDARVRRMLGRWAMLTHGAPSMRYVLATQSPGLAAARNVGWRSSQGDIVAFVGEDMVPRFDWLTQGARVMSRGVNAVSGTIADPPGVALVEDDLDAVDAGTFGLSCANCFVQRQALQAIGGFDERFAEWDEDSDLQFKLIEAHGELAAAPEAVVARQAPARGLGATLHRYRKNASDALLFKKHRRLYRGRARHATPWNYYFVVAAIVMVMVGALLREPDIAWGGLGIWLAFTAEVLSQRLRQSRTFGEALAAAIAIPPVAVFWRLAGALRFRVFFL